MQMIIISSEELRLAQMIRSKMQSEKCSEKMIVTTAWWQVQVYVQLGP